MADFVSTLGPARSSTGGQGGLAAARAHRDLSALQLRDARRPAGAHVMSVFDWVVQLMGIALAVAAAPLFLGWVNQCRAWLQNKSAPSILLPYRGIRKLFHKDAVIAASASPLFRVAPYIVFGAMVVAAGIIPSMGTR